MRGCGVPEMSRSGSCVVVYCSGVVGGVKTSEDTGPQGCDDFLPEMNMKILKLSMVCLCVHAVRSMGSASVSRLGQFPRSRVQTAVPRSKPKAPPAEEPRAPLGERWGMAGGRPN